MGQRNRTVDLEMDQQQSQASSQAEPDSNSIPVMVTNVPTLEAYDNSGMLYALPQYHHHPHQRAPTNFYLPYIAFQAPPSQLPSSSSHGQFMDHARGTYKRKNDSQYLSTPFNSPETVVAPFGGSMNPLLPPHAPNYAGHHPFPPPGSIWYDQHLGRSDGSSSFWPQAPYMHGSIESSSRNPRTIMYPSQLNPRDHYYSHHHHPVPPPIQGATLYPHMAPPGSFAPQNIMNSGPSGSVQPNGFRALRQHRGGVPRLRLMPNDEVAVLEFDHHRDMRLDIEEMSYEELLALSERIGTVNTGLPEEDVKNHLKTRTCSGINLEEEECTICQESFKNGEKIATLDCGHEYHVVCLEKWLIVKNVCPICKSEALVMEKRKV